MESYCGHDLMLKWDMYIVIEHNVNLKSIFQSSSSQVFQTWEPTNSKEFCRPPSPHAPNAKNCNFKLR